MFTREELLKSPEYWFEANQNDVFAEVRNYLNKENITQNGLAERLNVSKGYISQILNGNANFTMKKLVEFFLLIGKVPSISFTELNDILTADIDNINKAIEECIVISKEDFNKKFQRFKMDNVLSHDRFQKFSPINPLKAS